MGPALEHGRSTRVIRNREDAGILPAAERTVHDQDRQCSRAPGDSFVDDRPSRDVGQGLEDARSGRGPHGARSPGEARVRGPLAAFSAPRNRT